MGKKEQIMKHAEEFLNSLSRQCISHCGKRFSAVELPVFKKFLNYRVKRELEFYRLCLEHAVLLHEAGTKLTAQDIDEILEESISIDKKLLRDIRFLPLRIEYDYNRILPLRRKRTELQLKLFYRLLEANSSEDFSQMVKEVFTKQQYLDINNDIVELYTEEAFIINSSIKSIIKIDSEVLAHNMFCSMLDVGFKLNREFSKRLFNN
ncbi:MAG: hypothetical protein D6710_05730 [Nitrospirae bacterium]|nr:MAG: hypothetical protein D6710_05730 [Nitrospirota bacterium]